jgi:peroxiredoxin
MKPGDPAPEFALPAVDGRTYRLQDFAGDPVLVVMFTCNHCPYVQAYERRLIDLQRDYAQRGVRLVAINANDARTYPEDSFQRMIERAAAQGYNFPYLRDESQETARAYGASHTPQVFVFDGTRRLRYTGKIDDNWNNPAAVRRHHLREALDAILEGRGPAEPATYAIGCTIKWGS